MGAVTPVSDSSAKMLRIVLVLDAAVFAGAALFNFGFKVPLGFTTLSDFGLGVPQGSTALGFADPIWQAGTGEAVIGLTLLAGGLTRGRRLSWVALVTSALGIAFGLSSERVQGAARDLHVVLIALAVLVLVLLLVTGRRNRRSVAERAASTEEAK